MQFRFAEHVLDVARRELRRGGEPIALEPQVFDLLVYLIRNRERVVTKDDLVSAVWGGRIVSESTLTSRINAARRAVGDTGEAQRLIRTSPRKGVRFVGEVTEPQPAGPTTPHISQDRPSIAVLPFDNLSGDQEQEYFADGIVAEIITGLSRIKWLFVISRNSTFIYKGKPIDVKTVGRELGVRYVLEGSVRRSGDHVRLTGQLIETETATHVWADRYDGTLGDIFTLQDEMTMSVIGAVEPTLRKAEVERARRKRPETLDAYDLFLRALPFAATAMPEDADKALQLLEEAIRLEPDYAIVHGFIAWCHEQRYLRGGLHTETREAARQTCPCGDCGRKRRCDGAGDGRFCHRRHGAGLRHRSRCTRPRTGAESIVGARVWIQFYCACLDGRQRYRDRAWQNRHSPQPATTL